MLQKGFLKYEGDIHMDYVAFCRQFFSVTGVPVTLVLDNEPVYSSLGEALSYHPPAMFVVYPADRNPEFSSINPDLEYGHVHIEGTGYDLFLGPIFTAPINEKLVQEFFEETRIPAEYQEEAAELLYQIPVGGHPQFMRYLSFIHLCLNHKEIRIEEFYAEDAASRLTRGQKTVDVSVDAKENQRSGNSYDFEKELYYYIALGNTGRLKTFLETASIPEEGKVASLPLRQAKNIFIGLAAKAGVLGAIPGGVDVDRVYQLIGLYTQECEQMHTIEEVHRLQYILLMDFCQRAGEAKFPQNISSEIRSCAAYIQNHTNTVITVDEIAEQIHRSPSYLMKHFKDELGMSVGDYITKCKMEEARNLLIFSERSLAEISAYLGYSSQSYFQNVFKKQFGITPLQYRKQQR